MTNNITSFTRDFQGGDHAQWAKAVEQALKGRPMDALRSATYDALSIEPLYDRRTNATPLAGRAQNTTWQIVQRLDHRHNKDAATQALVDLENGCSALSLIFASSPAAYGFGLQDWDASVFEAVLEDVDLTAITLHLDGGWNSRRVAEAFSDWATERALDPASLDVVFNLDPLGALAATGTLAASWDEVGPKLAQTTLSLSDQGYKGPFAVADGRPYHAAGASEAQEVGALLSTGLAYLRAYDAAGIDLNKAARWISFTLALDADQFAGISKIRALKAGWARILSACDLSGIAPRIHGETSWRMMTRHDPHVNMLRVTTATFAAAVAGLDSLTVLPFTQAIGLPDAFARRIARNTHLILSAESNLHKVCDPVAGSGFSESLTDQIGTAAWTLFQTLEAEGGVAAALTAGSLQDRVAETATVRHQNIAKRKDALTGVSTFPNILEQPASVEDDTPSAPFMPKTGAVEARPLAPHRLSEPFEALRDRAEALDDGGASIFLANLGTIAQFTARATWIKNLFEAGGIKTNANDGFDTVDAVVKSFQDSGASIACLCSSDAVYETRAEETVKALKAAGAKALYLAGRPGPLEDTLRQAGITRFVYAGADVVSLLNETHNALQH